MRFTFTFLAGTASAAILIFTGCQNGVGLVTPPQSSLSSRTALRGHIPTVYVLQDQLSASYQIVGYPAQNRRNRSPLCGRTFGTPGYGFASDKNGALYVASDNSSGGVIEVHAPNCGNVSRTVNDSFNEPFAIAVRGNSLYAAGYDSIQRDIDIAVCNLRACTGRLTDRSISQLLGLAVDSHGNVWASFYDTYGYVRLRIWQHGAMPGHDVGGFQPYNPGEILFDNHDNLVVIEYRTPKAYTFSCDAQRAKCTQTGEFTLKDTAQYGALNNLNTDVQIVNYDTNAIDVYSYPSFKFEYSYDRGSNGPSGITQIGG